MNPIKRHSPPFNFTALESVYGERVKWPLCVTESRVYGNLNDQAVSIPPSPRNAPSFGCASSILMFDQ